MGDRESKTEQLKVFISYSRAQVAFADELELALTDKGHEVLIDRHSIAKGEAFRERLAEMILACDSVVFILSDESAASEVCQWEVTEASRLLKRVLVVSIAELSKSISAPEDLASIDWIHCWNNPKVPGSNQTKGIIELDRALRTDLSWLRQRTRLHEQAVFWSSRSKKDNHSSSLLRGELLQEAMDWASKKPAAESLPDVLLDFLAASADAEENRRAEEAANLAEREAIIEKSNDAILQREAALKRLSRRTFVGVGVAAALTTASAGLAYWGVNAERRFDREKRQRLQAEMRSVDRLIENEAAREDIMGQLVGYAASPGSQAWDRVEGIEGSPYSSLLVESFNEPRLSLNDALARVHREIRALTQGSQRPFLSSDLNGEVFLHKRPESRSVRALVLSADQWGEMLIPGTKTDATLWSELFSGAGVAMDHYHNVSSVDEFNAKIEESLSAFGDPPEGNTSVPNSLFFFVYAGAGISVREENRIPVWPVGVDYREELGPIQGPDYYYRYYSNVEQRSVAVSKVLSRIRAVAATSVAILDTGFGPIDQHLLKNEVPDTNP
nr:TIR domain-containing protein [Hyphomonas sp. Mor2]